MTPADALVGCRLEPLSDALAWLRWVTGEDEPPAQAREQELKWLLAHCLDGVTWGYSGEAGWRLGCRAFPEISPEPRRDTLLELRLFGPRAEVLLWSDPQGLRGRILEEDDPAEEGGPLAPAEEALILLGDRPLDRREGFTRLRARTGAEQVVPVEVEIEDLEAHRWRLELRHYFHREPDTGAVRVAVSRLVDLYREEDHDHDTG